MTDETHLREIAANIRANLISVLRTFASPVEQWSYQAQVPFVNVPTELLCQWADDLYHPDEEAFRFAFGPAERTALAEFNQTFERAAAAFSDAVPRLIEFQATPQAADLARAAAKALTLLDALSGV